MRSDEQKKILCEFNTVRHPIMTSCMSTETSYLRHTARPRYL
jgi:hypothetical protein